MGNIDKTDNNAELRQKIHKVVDELLDDSFRQSDALGAPVKSLVIGMQSLLENGTYGYALSSTDNKTDFMPYIVFPATTFTSVASYAKEIIDTKHLPDSEKGRLHILLENTITAAMRDGKDIIYGLQQQS